MLIKKILPSIIAAILALTTSQPGRAAIRNYKNPDGGTTITLPRATVETGGLNKVDFVTLREFSDLGPLSKAYASETEEDFASPLNQIWTEAFPNIHNPYTLCQNIRKYLLLMLEHECICICTKAPFAARILFTLHTINSILERFPDKATLLHYVSFAGGNGGQALVTLLALIHAGYKNITLSLIDPDPTCMLPLDLLPLISSYNVQTSNPYIIRVADNTAAAQVTFVVHRSTEDFLAINREPQQFFIDFCDASWPDTITLAGGSDFYTLLCELALTKPLVLTLFHFPVGPDAERRTPWPGICQFFPTITDMDF